MRRVLLSDLFSTLVPGGEAERDVIHAQMAQVLGVDPVAFAREFEATSRERFVGAYGDLPNTIRVISRRAGGDPTDEQVQRATNVRQGRHTRRLGRAEIGRLADWAGQQHHRPHRAPVAGESASAVLRRDGVLHPGRRGQAGSEDLPRRLHRARSTASLMCVRR